MNIMAKQDEHAMVASFDSQYRHCGASDEIAAPQLGQLRVWASMINYALAQARVTAADYHFERHLCHEKIFLLDPLRRLACSLLLLVRYPNCWTNYSAM